MNKLISIEERIKMLEDKEKIRETIHKYAWLLDKKKWDDLIELFSEDATLIVHPYGTHKGKDEIRSFFFDILDKRPPGFHYIANSIITIERDKGKSESFWHSTGEREGKSMVVAGFYYHELVRERDDNWYIKKKEIYIDYNVPLEIGWGGLRQDDRIWGDAQGRYTPPKEFR